ncbi:DUF2752 domain-containing protein [Aeromicrobium piscarium]|nr:DUF2752 domain-containing protein [Aeromicrobium piscarium]
MATVTTTQRSRWQLVRGPLLTGAVGAAAIAVLHLRDPHQQGSYGTCPFLFLTGIPCPGCGGLRAINLATDGEWTAAVSSNVFALGLVAAAILAWGVWLVRRARGRDVALLPSTATWAWVVLGIAVAFWIFRLTPAGAWFAP